MVWVDSYSNYRERSESWVESSFNVLRLGNREGSQWEDVKTVIDSALDEKATYLDKPRYTELVDAQLSYIQKDENGEITFNLAGNREDKRICTVIREDNGKNVLFYAPESARTQSAILQAYKVSNPECKNAELSEVIITSQAPNKDDDFELEEGFSTQDLKKKIFRAVVRNSITRICCKSMKVGDNIVALASSGKDYKFAYKEGEEPRKIHEEDRLYASFHVSERLVNKRTGLKNIVEFLSKDSLFAKSSDRFTKRVQALPQIAKKYNVEAREFIKKLSQYDELTRLMEMMASSYASLRDDINEKSLALDSITIFSNLINSLESTEYEITTDVIKEQLKKARRELEKEKGGYNKREDRKILKGLKHTLSQEIFKKLEYFSQECFAEAQKIGEDVVTLFELRQKSDFALIEATLIEPEKENTVVNRNLEHAKELRKRCSLEEEDFLAEVDYDLALAEAKMTRLRDDRFEKHPDENKKVANLANKIREIQVGNRNNASITKKKKQYEN